MKKVFFVVVIIFIFIAATTSTYKVDTGKTPYTPDPSWKVVSNENLGQVEIDPLNISLLRVDKKFLSHPDGNILSANILDFFLENPELIPKNWEDKRVIFTGTVYSDPSGNKLFRILKFEGEWNWGRFYPEDEIVFDNLYIAIFKK